MPTRGGAEYVRLSYRSIYTLPVLLYYMAGTAEFVTGVVLVRLKAGMVCLTIPRRLEKNLPHEVSMTQNVQQGRVRKFQVVPTGTSYRRQTINTARV